MKQAIASSLQLFAVFAFVVSGVCCLALPYLPEAKIRLAHVLLEEGAACRQAGVILLSTAFLFFLGFYGVNRGKELRLRMGARPISVHVRLIEELLEQQLKPYAVVLQGVEILNGKKVEISVAMGPVEPKQREALLKEVEQSLQTLFRERFGYFKPFYLCVKIGSNAPRLS